MTRLEATQLLDLVAKARKTAREAVRYQHDAAAQADDEALRALIGWVHEHIDAEDDGGAPVAVASVVMLAPNTPVTPPAPNPPAPNLPAETGGPPASTS